MSARWVVVLALFVGTVASSSPRDGEERPPLPADNLPADLPAALPKGLEGTLPEVSEDEVRLGRRLFFDPLLSRDGSVSCASCHDPERGFADGERFSLGIGGQRTLRNSPSIVNRAFSDAQMWDGRAETLARQALLPIADAREMGSSVAEAVARLAASKEYAPRFAAVYGGPPDEERLGRAIAAFVGRLTFGDSPVDRFRVDNDFAALTREERAGLWFYESRGRCWKCHSGPNFTDEEFHNTGVGVVDGRAEDGRMKITGLATDRGRFKTPTLRGVALTAPYMHDGSLATLEEVVRFYQQGGVANPDLSDEIESFEMSDEDAANLVAFLKALSRRAGPSSAAASSEPRAPGEGAGHKRGR